MSALPHTQPYMLVTNHRENPKVSSQLGKYIYQLLHGIKVLE